MQTRRALRAFAFPRLRERARQQAINQLQRIITITLTIVRPFRTRQEHVVSSSGAADYRESLTQVDRVWRPRSARRFR